MTAQILDGRAIAAALRDEIGEDARSYAAQYGRPPTLAAVLVGDDPASHVYIRNKTRTADETGIRSRVDRLPADTPQAALIARVRALSADDEVDGILVQLPLPAGLDPLPVIDAIAPDKDVDGLTDVSAGRLLAGKAGLRPCTPSGCVHLAERALGRLDGKHCVVVGRSILVGKPAALLFLEKNCTTTIAHSRTHDAPQISRQADILIAATGRPEMIGPDWIKPGACVIDVGLSRVPAPEKGEGGTKLVGDVAFAAAKDVAGFITPAPGGVGPMTVAYLMANTVRAARRRRP